jgi:hypothetical protein
VPTAHVMEPGSSTADPAPGKLQAVGPSGAGARTLQRLPLGGHARSMSMNFLRPGYADRMRPPEW